MRLTSFTDYSLRVLLYAEAHQNELFTIEQLANAYSISRAHLMKVVNLMTREGYLEAIRGRSGGLRLKKKAEEINLGELLNKTEPDFRLVECMRADNACILCGRCKLPGPLSEAMTAFHAVLAKYTLADIALNPQAFLGNANQA